MSNVNNERARSNWGSDNQPKNENFAIFSAYPLAAARLTGHDMSFHSCGGIGMYAAGEMWSGSKIESAAGFESKHERGGGSQKLLFGQWRRNIPPPPPLTMFPVAAPKFKAGLNWAPCWADSGWFKGHKFGILQADELWPWIERGESLILRYFNSAV